MRLSDRAWLWALAVGVLLATPSPRAMASPGNMECVAAEFEPAAKGLDCLSCHTGWRHEGRGQIRRSLNPFGDAFKRWKRARREPLASMLALDSDADGISNREELERGSRPGDAKSVPGEPAADPIGLDPLGLDPAGRLADRIRQDASSSNRDRQRRAVLTGFLLALVSGDVKGVDAVLARAGYHELDATDPIKAEDLVRRWAVLRVAWPAGKPLDAVFDCAQTRFAKAATIRNLSPGIGKRLRPTHYPMIVPLMGMPDILEREPVLILERQSRQWRIIGGNILSCWADPAPASQPVEHDRASDPADANGRTTRPETTRPSGPKRPVAEE
ncbi:MAG: hypothetical protein JXA69_18040 [Phycisphaerae bacterium]|nr:hypothetical protein [Phycisphaerae bacterium]